jgi:hypothetical protein
MARKSISSYHLIDYLFGFYLCLLILRKLFKGFLSLATLFSKGTHNISRVPGILTKTCDALLRRAKAVIIILKGI